MKKLLTPKETAKELRCSLPQIYAFSSRGTLPKYKIGNRLFFAREDIEAFVEGCRVDAREPVMV